jgi:hypothetical protein
VARACGALLAGFLVLAASVGLERAEAQPASCNPSLTASTDDSFAQAGWNSNPARLSRLAALTRDRFAAAVRRLCAAGVLKPADVARFRRLVVQNGEGATEPLLYRNPATAPRAFIFQYAFQNGGPPDLAAFEQALRCWKRPQNRGCESGD